MRKYLAYYENEWPANIAELTAVENKPFVGYLEGEGVLFTVIPKPADPNTYITFTAEADSSSIGLTKLSPNQTLEYSTDTTTWNTFDTETNISLNNGDKVYVRGILSADNTSSNYTQFKMTGKIAASGNCNAIWNYQDLNAPLKAYCGRSMFSYCASLITAPELPATELAEHCYEYMFSNCSYLTTAASELPATELANYCYSYMFLNCQDLATAPILPATKLANNCYYGMFYGCHSFTTAPELPAVVLADGCYYNMFAQCVLLEKSPVLSATSLPYMCYTQMFMGCTNLKQITCLATDRSGTYCTASWVNRVTGTGTFIKHPSATWSTGQDGVPSGWTVEDAEL